MLRFEDFKKAAPHTTEDLSKEIFDRDLGTIKIKKKDLAVRNLVKIFDATLSLSNSKGFRSMSLRDLSKEVGMTMGGLYLYFKNKDDLIDLIQNQSIRMIERIYAGLHEKNLGPREALGEAICHYLYLSEATRPWFYFLYLETKNFSVEQKRKAIRMEEYVENIFKEILNRGCSAGVFRVDDTLITASLINAMLMDWFLKKHKYDRRGITVENYASTVIRYLEGIVLARSG
jgi:AcrR family transcriptional regulator